MGSGIACSKKMGFVIGKERKRVDYFQTVEKMRKEEEDSKETEGEIKLFFVLYLPQRL